MIKELVFISFIILSCKSPTEPVVDSPFTIDDLRPYINNHTKEFSDVTVSTKSYYNRTIGENVTQAIWQWTCCLNELSQPIRTTHYAVYVIHGNRLIDAGYNSSPGYYSANDFSIYIDTVWNFLDAGLRNKSKEHVIQVSSSFVGYQIIGRNKFIITAGAGGMNVDIKYEFADGWH